MYIIYTNYNNVGRIEELPGNVKFVGAGGVQCG